MTTTIASARATGSAAQSAEALIKELKSGLGGQRPSFVFVFSSLADGLQDLLPRVAKTFSEAPVLGATTAGEFNQGGDTQGGASAVAVAGDMQVQAHYAAGLRAAPEAAVGK